MSLSFPCTKAIDNGGNYSADNCQNLAAQGVLVQKGAVCVVSKERTKNERTAVCETGFKVAVNVCPILE